MFLMMGVMFDHVQDWWAMFSCLLKLLGCIHVLGRSFRSVERAVGQVVRGNVEIQTSHTTHHR